MKRGGGRRILLARVLYALGLVHLWGLVGRLFGAGGPRILTGHRVVPEGGDDVDRIALASGHAITPQALDRRLRFLRRWAMPAGHPTELARGIPRGRRFYLTFDDGYRDNLLHAAPVLKRHGVEAVIFVVADLVRHPHAQPWWDRWGASALQRRPSVSEALADYNSACAQRKATCTGLDEEDLEPGPARRYLDMSELQSLAEPFFVANHSRSHANLACLDAQTLQRHLEEGEDVIRAHPRRLPVLAYPFGTRSAAVLDALRSKPAYALALATGGGVEGDPWQQRRQNLNAQPFALFAAQAVGLMR